MKNLKYITIFFIIAFGNCAQGQIGNVLTSAEYINIKINRISFAKIDSTKGNISQMKALFGDDINIKKETEPGNMISFWNSNLGLSFRFEENEYNSGDYVLNYFRISSKSSNFTILGKTVTIGSDISELGDVKIDSRESEISFSTKYHSTSLTIKFDPSTRKIIEIRYITYI